jgi:hypothetical protein
MDYHDDDYSLVTNKHIKGGGSNTQHSSRTKYSAKHARAQEEIMLNGASTKQKTVTHKKTKNQKKKHK